MHKTHEYTSFSSIFVREDHESSILVLITLAHFLCFFGLPGEILEKNFGEKCVRVCVSSIYHHQNLKSQSNELALGCIAKTRRVGVGRSRFYKKMADSVSPPKPKITT